MKKINLIIKECGNCPCCILTKGFVEISSYNSNEDTINVLGWYCSNKEIINDYNGIKLIIEKSGIHVNPITGIGSMDEPKFIPDWCPLEDVEESQNVIEDFSFNKIKNCKDY